MSYYAYSPSFPESSWCRIYVEANVVQTKTGQCHSFLKPHWKFPECYPAVPLHSISISSVFFCLLMIPNSQLYNPHQYPCSLSDKCTSGGRPRCLLGSALHVLKGQKLLGFCPFLAFLHSTKRELTANSSLSTFCSWPIRRGMFLTHVLEPDSPPPYTCWTSLFVFGWEESSCSSKNLFKISFTINYQNVRECSKLLFPIYIFI